MCIRDRAYTVATNSGVTSTSTTVSFDATGSTVIVVESSTAGSVLHILKWNAGDGVTGGIVDTTPPTPAAATTGTWANCGGGQPACMWSINFTPDPTGTTDATDSNSAPFYDYTNDVLYLSLIHIYGALEFGGQVGIQAYCRNRVTIENLVEDDRRTLPTERQSAGGHLVEDLSLIHISTRFVSRCIT